MMTTRARRLGCLAAMAVVGCGPTPRRVAETTGHRQVVEGFVTTADSVRLKIAMDRTRKKPAKAG